MTAVFSLLMILLAPLAGIAQDGSSGYVRVTIEYKSMFPGKIQVLDQVCRDSRSIDCAKASIKTGSEECQKKPLRAECKEARALLDTSFCIEGLIYENRIAREDKVAVSLCASEAGFGTMSIRDISKNEIWTNYFLLSDGQTVSFP
jgi:hypothetical protein